MKNNIYNKEELKEIINTAINVLTNPVKSTLGPYGKTVIINKNNNYYPTKDGVSVAKSIKADDIAVNLIISLIKDIAEKTNKEVGDGTSTSLVLAQAILNEIYKSEQLHNLQLSKQLHKDLEDILNYIDLEKIEIGDKYSIYDVALISANGNKEIASFVEQAYKNVDKNGIIDIQESPTGSSYIEQLSGYTLTSGAVSENFIDETKQRFVSDNAMCMVIDGKLLDIKSITSLLEYVLRINKDLLIIAEDFGEDVLKILERNNYKNNIKFIPVKIPGIRHEKKELLKDISTYINTDMLSSINSKNTLGDVDKIIITRHTTTIQKENNNGLKRIEQLNTLLNEHIDNYKKEKVRERIKILEGFLSTIYVGGKSDMEIKELIDRVEDAVNAAKAALKEGILPGRGIALRDIANKYYEGNPFIYNILHAPYNAIYENAEIKPLHSLPKNKAIDIETGKVINVLDELIIDPALVTKTALKNAFAIVSILLTTNTLIIDDTWIN